MSLVIHVNSYAISYAKTLFYCNTTKYKQVLVEQKEGFVYYMYGRSLEKPEIKLKRKLSEVSFEKEGYSGGGANVITIRNGSYSYELRSGIRKICYGENCKTWHEDFGSISVIKGYDTLAEIECLPKSIQYNEPDMSVHTPQL